MPLNKNLRKEFKNILNFLTNFSKGVEYRMQNKGKGIWPGCNWRSAKYVLWGPLLILRSWLSWQQSWRRCWENLGRHPMNLWRKNMKMEFLKLQWRSRSDLLWTTHWLVSLDEMHLILVHPHPSLSLVDTRFAKEMTT